jgi:glycosyltransferase involved in cell wall biosynthesis
LTAISRWIKLRTNIRILYICHNVVPHDGGGTLDRRLASTVLRRGDVFLVHSEQDRLRLKILLPQATIIKTALPNFAEISEQRDSHPAKLRAQLQLPDDRPVLLFFGFVRPYKGLEYLIQALPHVLKQLPVHLLVVGEFWSSPEFYRRYAREFGVEEAITFVDQYVPNEEMKPYFDLADVVVLPYVTATQSGIAQLAFGFGKPVITTRVGGLPEVVRDGVTGLIVPPQDEQALAQAITRFFLQHLQQDMTRNVRQLNDDATFSWRTLVVSIEQAAQVAPKR